MLFWIYNSFLLLLSPLISLFSLYNAFFKHKRALATFWRLPKSCSKTPSLWIHAVSLGEVNTAKALIEGLKKQHPGTPIFISTVTETGFLSASSIQNVTPLYLPLDLWFLQKKLMKQLSPKLVIFIEGDVWPSLSFLLKKQKISQIIFSAKLSHKSADRLKRWPAMAQFLYQALDVIGAQDQTMVERFISIGLKKQQVQLTGNLKLTHSQKAFDEHQILIQFLNLDPTKKTVVLSCTHEGEELLILSLIKPLLPEFNLIIAPRHPQRFSQVEKELEEACYPLSVLSHPSQERGIYLIDAIGVLDPIYQKADLTLLGGSFIHGVGGHNVMEPIYQGCPVLVGPYAFRQQSLVDLMLKNHLGEVVGLQRLLPTIEAMLATSSYKESIAGFMAQNLNILQVHLDLVAKYVKNKI